MIHYRQLFITHGTRFRTTQGPLCYKYPPFNDAFTITTKANKVECIECLKIIIEKRSNKIDNDIRKLNKIKKKLESL